MDELERLAGTVLCVGVQGEAPEASALDELRQLAPGGLVLFARNVTTPERTRALVATLREASDSDPYVAVDQEGGRVARLRDGATDLPSMMALGAAGDERLAQRAGRVLAGDLRAFGCDLDFAPVTDLSTDPRSTVIGTRAFGDDPERAGSLAAAVVRGLQAGGAGATLKHFPGHGATSIDSHRSLPFVDAPLAMLRARELAAFARALEADPVAVMSAHVVVRALDARRPATLAPRVLGDLLRGELGFEGACFSDCLEMGAIAERFGSEAGALAALAAGCDVLTISHTLALARRVRVAIVAAVRSGALPLARLEEAASRVARLRARLRSLRAHASGALSATEARETALSLARRAVTIVRGDARLAPAAPVTIVSFEATTEDGIAGARTEYASLNLALRTRGVRSEMLRVPLRPKEDDVALLIDMIAMQGSRCVVAIARRAMHHPEQARAIDALLARFPDALLIVAAEPFDAVRFPACENVACTYGDGESAFEGCAEVLTGRAPATGRLPVALPEAGALAPSA